MASFYPDEVQAAEYLEKMVGELGIAHEQFHGVLKKATTRPPPANLVAQRRRFNTFLS